MRLDIVPKKFSKIFLREASSGRKNSTSECRWFKMPLDDLPVVVDNGWRVPFLVKAIHKCLVEKGGLLEEGIFRTGATVNEVEDARSKLQAGCDVYSILKGCSTEVLASLLKSFLREIPGGICSFGSPDFISSEMPPELLRQRALPTVSSAGQKSKRRSRTMKVPTDLRFFSSRAGSDTFLSARPSSFHRDGLDKSAVQASAREEISQRKSSFLLRPSIRNRPASARCFTHRDSLGDGFNVVETMLQELFDPDTNGNIPLVGRLRSMSFLHRELLLWLLDLLLDVAANEKTTRMGVRALAVIFSSVFMPDDDNMNSETSLQNSRCGYLMCEKLLVLHQEGRLTGPGGLLPKGARSHVGKYTQRHTGGMTTTSTSEDHGVQSAATTVREGYNFTATVVSDGIML